VRALLLSLEQRGRPRRRLVVLGPLRRDEASEQSKKAPQRKGRERARRVRAYGFGSCRARDQETRHRTTRAMLQHPPAPYASSAFSFPSLRNTGPPGSPDAACALQLMCRNPDAGPDHVPRQPDTIPCPLPASLVPSKGGQWPEDAAALLRAVPDLDSYVVVCPSRLPGNITGQVNRASYDSNGALVRGRMELPMGLDYSAGGSVFTWLASCQRGVYPTGEVGISCTQGPSWRWPSSPQGEGREQRPVGWSSTTSFGCQAGNDDPGYIECVVKSWKEQ
jgi:hypothetical protein